MNDLETLAHSQQALDDHVQPTLPGADASRYRRLLDRLRGELDVAGSRPVFLVSAPGRTELAGNHTDHNNGKVLAASVQLDTIAAVAPRDDKQIVLVSEGFPRTEVSLNELDPRPDERESTAALVRGVAAALTEYGFATGGFDAALSSTVGAGSGLSSSASVEVLVGTIFNHGWNIQSIDPTTIAIAGRSAENKFFGKPSGLMDQVACATGGIVLIDFQNAGSPRIEHLDTRFEEGALSLLVVDTGGSHADLTAEYSSIPEEMGRVARALGVDVLAESHTDALLESLQEIRRTAGDRAVTRAFHFFRENDRVQLMFDALRARDFRSYVGLMAESGRSSAMYLQNTAAGTTGKEQAVVVALAVTEQFFHSQGLTPGMDAACRVHGGGFAGTIQVLLPTEAAAAYRSFAEELVGPATELSIRPTGPLAW